MSELPHDIVTVPVDKNADVIPFPHRQRSPEDKSLDPAELEADELVDAFFSQFRHPSARGMKATEIADIIKNLLDADMRPSEVEHVPARDLTWRQSYLKLSVDSLELPLEEWKRIESEDEVLSAIVAARRGSGNEAELAALRRALEGLINFRLGVTLQAIASNDDDWRKLLDRLQT